MFYIVLFQLYSVLPSAVIQNNNDDNIGY